MLTLYLFTVQQPPRLRLDQQTLSAALSQAQSNINMEAVNSANPPHNLLFTNNPQDEEDENSAWADNNQSGNFQYCFSISGYIFC